MSDTKDLRAEVEATSKRFARNWSRPSPPKEEQDALSWAYLQGATSPDSPLLKRAIELLDVAIDRLYDEDCYAGDLDDGIKEIRECQEAMR